MELDGARKIPNGLPAAKANCGQDAADLQAQCDGLNEGPRLLAKSGVT